MKQTLIVLLLLFAGFPTVSPQVRLRSESNLPRPGDELLWAGVRTEPDNTILNKISGVIFDGLNKFNIKINGSNNKFKPHITLARRVEFNKNLNGDIVKQIKFTPINFTVNSITLMESVQEIKTYGDKLYTRIIYKPLYERNF